MVKEQVDCKVRVL